MDFHLSVGAPDEEARDERIQYGEMIGKHSISDFGCTLFRCKLH